MRERLAGATSAARDAAALDIDGALTPRGVNDELIDLIERAGPLRPGQPAAALRLSRRTACKFAKVMGEAHVRCTLEAGDGSRIDAVAFRAVGQPLGDLLLAAGGMPIARRRAPAPRHLGRPRKDRADDRGRRRSARATVVAVSLRVPAAVDVDSCAVDETGFVAREEQCGACHFLWLADPHLRGGEAFFAPLLAERVEGDRSRRARGRS